MEGDGWKMRISVKNQFKSWPGKRGLGRGQEEQQEEEQAETLLGKIFQTSTAQQLTLLFQNIYGVSRPRECPNDATCV